MPPPRSLPTVLLALLTALTACSAGMQGRGGGPDPFSGGVAERGTVTVLADNDNRLTAIVAVVTPEGTRVLGQIVPRETELFSFELAEEAEVRMVVELQTGESYRTGYVRAEPGDQLRLTVGSFLENSRLRR